MKFRYPAALTAAALPALLALTGCADSGATAVTGNVIQQCALMHDNDTPADPGDDYAEPVDDDVCEDDDDGDRYGWYYGGVPYRSGGHVYVRQGTRTAPIGKLLVVRPPAKGGSARTQGRTRSHNDSVKKALGWDQQTSRPGVGSSARSGDDLRKPASSSSVKTGTSNSRTSTNSRSTGGRSTTSRR